MLVGLSPLFHLKPCMFKIRGLRVATDKSVLLSVVAQSFGLIVFIYLCAGEDLSPSSNDTNEGCQWEIQTDEGWVPY
jgi:hypothetical protein